MSGTPHPDPVAALEELYASLPTVKCKGLCQKHCTTINMSSAERQRLIDETGRDIPVGELGAPCVALNFAGQCSVYAQRPLICRLWGVAAGMRCEYGCEPVPGPLPDAAAYDAIERAFVISGDRPGITAEERARALELIRMAGGVAGLVAHGPAAVRRAVAEQRRGRR